MQVHHGSFENQIKGDCQMKTIIWYGVGKNLCDHENEFLKETGMPMCLCDADETKQGNCYVFSNGQKRNILSLREVEEKYSEYELWVTLADHNCLCVYEYLIKYKQKEFIRFFGGREWRLGCFNMQNYIYISSDNVKTCAHYPYTKHFLFEPGAVLQEQDVIAKLNALEKWRIKTISLGVVRKHLAMGVLHYIGGCFLQSLVLKY